MERCRGFQSAVRAFDVAFAATCKMVRAVRKVLKHSSFDLDIPLVLLASQISSIDDTDVMRASKDGVHPASSMRSHN